MTSATPATRSKRTAPSWNPTASRRSMRRARSGSPTWSAAHDARLRRGMEMLGLRSTSTQEAALGTYVRLLLKWNRTYNLLGTDDADAVLDQHLLDGLAVLPALDRWLPGDPGTLVDVGSGGGLPGIPIAIMRPHLRVVLVEPIGKKAAFLRQAIAECGLEGVSVQEARLELLTRSELAASQEMAIAGPHFICRAFASLADFATLCLPLVTDDSLVLALKAARAEEEVEALRASVPCMEVLAVEPLSIPGQSAQRSLVVMQPARRAAIPAATTTPGA